MRSKYVQIAGFLLLSSSVILASCGGSSGGGAAAPAPSLAMKGTSGNAVNMNGTWTGCSYSVTDQENTRESLALNGSSAAVTVTIWAAAANANCTQTTAPDAIITMGVTAVLGAEGTATWNGTAPAGISPTAKATLATLTYNSATATLGSAAYVTNLNANNVCGGGWVLNVPKNVLNCTQIISSTTETDYWLVDDSAATLKWYTGSGSTAYQMDNSGPLSK